MNFSLRHKKIVFFLYMAFLSEKVELSYKKRLHLLKETDAFRVINGAADGFSGLTLDKFGDLYQIQFFDGEWISKKNDVVEGVKEVFNPKFLVSKFRLERSGRSLENPEMIIEVGNREDGVGIVKEGSAKFYVDLLDTINPGLFLDMRGVRLEIGRRAAGYSRRGSCRVLNLFSYTCAFSVHARLGGADLSTNADISGKILEKGRANYALNGLECRPGEFFRGNALEYVAWANKKGLRFDIIVLDPPSFARFKGVNFNVREHLMGLVADCARLLNPGAVFMVSSNYSEFNLNDFSQSVLDEVARVRPEVKKIWSRGQGEDFVGSGSTKDSCLCATLVQV